MGEYNNISDWLERIQTSVPGYEKANGEPVEMFKQMVQASQGNTEDGEGGGEEAEGEEEKEEEDGGEEENK